MGIPICKEYQRIVHWFWKIILHFAFIHCFHLFFSLITSIYLDKYVIFWCITILFFFFYVNDFFPLNFLQIDKKKKMSFQNFESIPDVQEERLRERDSAINVRKYQIKQKSQRRNPFNIKKEIRKRLINIKWNTTDILGKIINPTIFFFSKINAPKLNFNN